LDCCEIRFEFKDPEGVNGLRQTKPREDQVSTTGATVPGTWNDSSWKSRRLQWRNVVFKSVRKRRTAVLGRACRCDLGEPRRCDSFYRGRAMRLLTSLSDKRWKWVPDVPSIRELGYDFHVNAYMGYGAPKECRRPPWRNSARLSKKHPGTRNSWQTWKNSTPFQNP